MERGQNPTECPGPGQKSKKYTHTASSSKYTNTKYTKYTNTKVNQEKVQLFCASFSFKFTNCWMSLLSEGERMIIEYDNTLWITIYMYYWISIHKFYSVLNYERTKLNQLMQRSGNQTNWGFWHLNSPNLQNFALAQFIKCPNFNKVHRYDLSTHLIHAFKTSNIEKFPSN